MFTHLNPFSQSGNYNGLQRILIITGCLSLFFALWDSLISIPFQLPLLSAYFTLSLYGIKSFYLWQFLSYFFVMSTLGMTIHLFYIVSSLITLYLIWILGSAVYDHAGKKQFTQLYLLSGLVAGFVTFLAMWISGFNTILSGPTAPLLTLFTAWTFLYPDVELLLFFVLPIRSKWLFAAVVGTILILAIVQFDFVSLIYYLTAIAIGYGYSALAWEIGSPYPQTYMLDRRLISLGQKIKGYSSVQTSKIVDISSGNTFKEDEEFVDEMLQKISKQGQNALTWAERKRLDEIAKKKSSK